MKATWQVQEAKAELSALIAAAQDSPQVITRRGEPVAVVISFERFAHLSVRENRETLFDFFRTWPDFEVPKRDPSDFGRDVTF